MRRTPLEIVEDIAADMFGRGTAVELDMRPIGSTVLITARVWSAKGAVLEEVSIDRSKGRPELVAALRDHLDTVAKWR